MESKLRGTFDKIHADAALKERTAEYLRGKSGNAAGRHGWDGSGSPPPVPALLPFLFAGGFACFTPSAYVDMDESIHCPFAQPLRLCAGGIPIQ